jgi:hypothetical protein
MSFLWRNTDDASSRRLEGQEDSVFDGDCAEVGAE